MAAPRPTGSRWPARSRRRVATSGPCNSWLTHRRAGGRGRDLPRDRAADAPQNELKPWLKEPWCLAPEADAAFVAAREDVLDVSERPPDSQRPLVCLDEA